MTLAHPLKMIGRAGRSAFAALSAALLWSACGSETGLRADFELVDPVDVLPCEFQPISGTRMSVYDCNPVFTSVDEVWSEGVGSVAFRTQYVLGHPMFQVWYTSELSGGLTGWGLGHAMSADGITWTAHPDNPLYSPRTGWDAGGASALNIAYDSDAEDYALTYQGQNLGEGSLGLGLLRSFDGVLWREPEAGSRLIDLTNRDVCWPLGMSWTPSRGYSGFVAFSRRANTCEAYGFEADELETGSLEVGDSAAVRAGPQPYDRSGVLSTATVELNGAFYLFYVGFETWVPAKVPGFVVAAHTSLALATSDDGVSWAKAAEENPLPVNLTSPGQIRTVAAQAIGERIHVWVTDEYPELGQRGIGYYLYDPGIEPHP